jgi:hypothetical protein
MKKIKLKFLRTLQTYLNKLLLKITEPILSIEDYQSLTPIDNADEDKTYSNAIEWALENRNKKNIKNIALTGSYGSGKSSILKTFQKNNPNCEYKFLNISLATFKDEINDKNEQKNNDELLRLIELSILQQIFYHVENNKIPDSRFKKINSISNKKLRKYTVYIIVWLFSIFNLFFPKLIYKLLLITAFSSNILVESIIHYSFLSLAVIGSFIFISKAIRVFNSSKINKLNIQSGEIEIDKEIDKSILNNHLDEILYFFEVTHYNVVIIEDLDRFGQTEIFTKLRELNSLINNSLQVGKEVVFIYAVKDDMFKDKDRTKFFDFIIPIIPVINSSNSNDILLKKLAPISNKISTDLIDDVSLFIDDMRLLNNILNEYKIYQSKLSEKLSQDKLLAMIVYKNIHPEDFVSLHNSEGLIYDIIKKKQEYLKIQIADIDKNIGKLNDEIKILERLGIKNIHELRAIYIEAIIEIVPKSVSISIDKTECTFKKLKEDSNFKKLLNQTSFRYYYFHPSYGYNMEDTANTKFSDVENLVDKDYSYLEREQQIVDWGNNKTELLKKEIELFNKEKITIKSLPLKEVLQRNENVNLLDNEKQNRLINILLLNGYIDEDYYDYISHFYEGSLTREDKDFLINVKSQVPSDFNYKLNKLDNLVKKIKDDYFEKEVVLNYNLVDFLLTNSKYKSKLKSTFNIIKNQSDNSIAFIDGYIEDGKNVSKFIKVLCEDWKEIWNYIELQSNFSLEKREAYLKLILEYADISTIKIIGANSKLVEFISNKKDFLIVIKDGDKIRKIIKELNPKFKFIDNSEQTSDLFNFVYEGNFYDINYNMIELILKIKSNSENLNLEEANYTAIQNSECNSLIKYIDDNIQKYISNVFLKRENKTKENEDAILKLLNNENLINSDKEKIISKEEALISNLTDIGDNEVSGILLKLSKTKPVWTNIIDYYEHNENVVDGNIMSFINNLENAVKLSKPNIPYSTENKELIQKLSKELILNKDIKDENYIHITKSIPFRYNHNLQFIELTKDKIKILINNGILSFSVENYELLKNNFDELHIQFLEYYAEDYLADIVSYKLDPSGRLKLLNSEGFTPEQKIEIITNTLESIITPNLTLTNKVCEIIANYGVYDISLTLLNHLVTGSKNNKDRITVFNLYSNRFTSNQITAFLQSMPHPYNEIAIKGKRPLIQNNQVNSIFVSKLKLVGYISNSEFEEKGIRIFTFRK